MPAPLSPTKLFQCQACGAALPIRSEHAGRRCRCGRCGKVMVVPHLEGRQKASPKKKKEPPSRQKPQAMHGQQYGLWGVDEAPTPEQLAASHPEYFPVHCRNCNTLMHATAEQIGLKISCPDCGVRALVVAPPSKPPPRQVLVPDGEEYQIDGPKVSEGFLAPIAAPPRQRDRPPKEEKNYYISSRPKCPRVPLLQGVGAMLWGGSVLTWWLTLSVMLMLVLPLVFGAFFGINSANGFAMVCFLAAGCILGVLWLGAASSLWLAVLTESSEGNDRLQNPPDPVPFEWFGNAAYLVLAVVVAAMPGVALGKLFDQPALAGGIGWLFCFPVVLLSMLEQGSSMAVWSPRLGASLWRRPWFWLLFFVESALLIAGTGFAMGWLAGRSPWLLLVAVMLGMAASLLYFHLLGRLGWWLAESMSTSEGDLE